MPVVESTSSLGYSSACDSLDVLRSAEAWNANALVYKRRYSYDNCKSILTCEEPTQENGVSTCL